MDADQAVDEQIDLFILFIHQLHECIDLNIQHVINYT